MGDRAQRDGVSEDRCSCERGGSRQTQKSRHGDTVLHADTALHADTVHREKRDRVHRDIVSGAHVNMEAAGRQ